MSRWSTLIQRAAGKWQLPLAAVSAVALPASMVLLKPDPAKISLDRAAETMEAFVESGLYQDAVRLGRMMLAREDCEGAACADIELNLARALFGRVSDQEPTSTIAAEIVGHFKGASLRNAELTAEDFEKFARSLEWEGQFVAALQWYDEAIDKGHPRPLELRRRQIELLRDRLDAPSTQLMVAVDDLLKSTSGSDLALKLWAIEEKIELLQREGRAELGEKLLDEHESDFANSDLYPRFAYQRALVLYYSARFDDAERLLRTVRNAVESHDEVNAMSGWLLGRVVMYDGGPQRPVEALSFFRDVERLHPDSVCAVASKIGSAEALALLERHDEAIGAYQGAIDALSEIKSSRLVNIARLRTSLSVTADQRRAAGELAAALSYSRLAAALISDGTDEEKVLILQQLASLQAALAARWETAPPTDAGGGAEGSGDFKKLYGEAADTYALLTNMDGVRSDRATEAAWLSADLAAKAGRRSDAIDRYRQFIAERPSDALVPRALLRVGQLLQRAGLLEDAVTAFRECYTRFPKTLDGIRTLIPLAQCYLAQGPEKLDLAESTLQLVVKDSNVFTPEAPEFSDALFLLGDVYSRQGRHEMSIATLEEASDRYPNDERVWRSRFLLANAYRRSAADLSNVTTSSDLSTKIERVRTESRERLAKARVLYREVIDEYEARGAARLDALERVYLRHAYLYEADCYFEAQEYRTALQLYDAAAAMFKNTPTALSAYVQVINCHAFLGQTQEAQAALARARVLADSMGPEVFERSLSPETKSDWQRYFQWLEESGLF